jgi:hypothetical protein
MARRRGKDIVIDDSTFQKRARRLAKLLKVNEYDFVKEQTALLAKETARFTPPYKVYPRKKESKGTAIGKKEDEIQGQLAIKNSVENIIFVQEDGVIDRMWEIFRNRPTYRGKRQTSLGIIENKSQLRRLHQRMRRPNGRTLPIRGIRHWVHQALLDEYLEEEYKKVGISKAAFAKAGMMLGMKAKVPKWVKRHIGKVSGGGRMARTSKGAYGIIRGNAPGLWHTSREVYKLQRDQLIKAVGRLRRIARAESKKAGFKVV